jgi:serine/threonine protein kinase
MMHMPLTAGTRLGAYEIVDKLGEGGMGQVYRARDARLGRDVAIKVLPPAFAADPDAVARFEREMKTLAGIPHPHIVAIYDAGHEGSMAYAVTELVDGDTLAEIVARGPLPIRKAIEYGIQIGRALAAAHDRGIVHRDLKPANVIVTQDGHIKVLDFGLARSSSLAAEQATTANTAPGMVMGTVGYMAPEQARGLPVDHRADIFAFGCVMYELITGKRAFDRGSLADTLSAILHEDPPPLSTQAPTIPAGLERVVQRCLEKDPAERFQSARDLAFALDALAGTSGPTSGLTSRPVTSRPARDWRRVAIAAAALAALAAAFALGRLLTPSTSGQPPTITQLTFERGVIRNARFAPDGETIVYGARWNGEPSKLFVARADTAESKPLDLPSGDVLAVARTGDLLLSLQRRYLTSWTAEGTLARARLFGSSAREILERVRDGDFLSGDALALARRVNGQDQLEVPQGNVVFQTPGYINSIRVSPDGKRVAFLEHPLFGDNRGYVALYDGRSARRLTPEYSGIETLCWSADGKEIWYGGANEEATWPIKAIDADVTTPRYGRIVWYVPTNLMLQDIDARGRVLLTANDAAALTAGAVAGDPRERTLSASGWVVPADISADGRTALLFISDSDPDYSVVLRNLDGSAQVKIGSGRGQELSPDGRWALAITPSTPYRVRLLPTGAGESRELDIGDVVPNVAVFVPGESLRVAVVGARNGSPVAAIIDVTTAQRTMIDLPELRGRAFNLRRFLRTFASPDGALLAVQADDSNVLAWPTTGGTPARTLAALRSDEAFAGWSSTPGHIFVATWKGPQARVESLAIASGRRTLVREITMADPAGALTTPDLFLSADGRSYLYGMPRMLSTLYVVAGLR